MSKAHRCEDCLLSFPDEVLVEADGGLHCPACIDPKGFAKVKRLWEANPYRPQLADMRQVIAHAQELRLKSPKMDWFEALQLSAHQFTLNKWMELHPREKRRGREDRTDRRRPGRPPAGAEAGRATGAGE